MTRVFAASGVKNLASFFGRMPMSFPFLTKDLSFFSYSSIGFDFSFLYVSWIGMSRTPPRSVRTRIFERTDRSREHLEPPLTSMGLERSNSKVLILKPNMQVIIVKRL